MMKINKIDTTHLRNSLHFQFHTEAKNLIQETGVPELKIETLFVEYRQRYNELDAALKKIVKSAATDKIHDADKERDAVFAGFIKTMGGLCEHYDPATRDAALKIQVVTHTYGNVAVKPLNEETSDIYNLVQDLKSDKYKDLVALVGLTQWVSKLEQQNNAFETLIKERDRENAAKNHTAVKEARQAVDESYKRIVETINALLVLNQLTGCAAFVETLNQIIHRLSVKRHRHGGKAEDTDGTGTEGDN